MNKYGKSVFITAALFFGGWLLLDLNQSGLEAEDFPELLWRNDGGHPLEFDESLGMYAQSDHVGLSYPFSAQALAEPLPARAVAAGFKDPAPHLYHAIGSQHKQGVHSHPDHRDSQARIARDADGRLWVCFVSYHKNGAEGANEDLFVCHKTEEGWSEPLVLTDHPLADFDPQMAFDHKGVLWVMWHRQQGDGRWPLMARRYENGQWSEDTLLVDGKTSGLCLATCPDKGLVMAYEQWDGGRCQVQSQIWDGQNWSQPSLLDLPHQAQRPTLAVGKDQAIWLACDVVQDHKYHLKLAHWDASNHQWQLVPDPPAIEGHRRKASLAIDAQNRVWVLPETLVQEEVEVRRGFNSQDVVYNQRPPHRSMLIWTGEDWKHMPPGPPFCGKEPRVHIDRQGMVWIFTQLPQYSTKDFQVIGACYQGDRWIVSPNRKGPRRPYFTLDSPRARHTKEVISLCEDERGLHIAWNNTSRQFSKESWEYLDGQSKTVYYHLPFDESREAVVPQLVDFDPIRHGTASDDVVPLPHAAMGRINHQKIIDGQTMQVYYGDLHHHSEFSRDPGLVNGDPDGIYRFVRDVRNLDYQAVADHAEHLNDHDWARIRRIAEFHNDQSRLTTFAGFEWTSEFYKGGNYQDGHHNVIYRTTGPEVKRYSASQPQSNTPLRLIEMIEKDIARAREHNVEANTLLFPHDSNRESQPITWSYYHDRIKLFELVQARGSHEILGGPTRLPLKLDSGLVLGKSAHDGLERGFRWGFIGNGDHQGRPIGGVYSPSRDRGAMFDSLFAKRTFATTGAKMAVSLSIDGHFMGSEWRGTASEHDMEVEVLGTDELSLIEVWKNGRLFFRHNVHEDNIKKYQRTFKEVSGPYLRENWWYLRAFQKDGEIAWSSPLWYVYEGIDPVVIADVGDDEAVYIMPHFEVPLPILMRNQKDETVKGVMRLEGAPDYWGLDPGPSMDFELPPDSWTTYVWMVDVQREDIEGLQVKAFELVVTYDDGQEVRKPVRVYESPVALDHRKHMHELNDAMLLQKDAVELNKWLKIKSKQWGLDQ